VHWIDARLQRSAGSPCSVHAHCACKTHSLPCSEVRQRVSGRESLAPETDCGIEKAGPMIQIDEPFR